MSEERERPVPAGGVRVVYDERGLAWLIREVESVAGGAVSRSLIFTTKGVMRRVRNHPPDWYEWADPDLIQLSRSATEP